MRKTYKKLISLCAVLILVLALIPVSAFAQDPFSAVIIGTSGLGGAGLFGATATTYGINVGLNSGSEDAYNGLWNDVSSNDVSISGRKHKASGTGTDTYDILEIDSTSTVNIKNYVSQAVIDWQLTNNSQVTKSDYTFDGVPLETRIYVPYGSSITLSNGAVASYLLSGNSYKFIIEYKGSSRQIDSTAAGNIGNYPNPSVRFHKGNDGFIYASAIYDNYNSGTYSILVNGQNVPALGYTITISATTIDYSPSDQKKTVLKIPSSVSQLPANFTPADFIGKFTELYLSGSTSDYSIEYESDSPVPPPVPVPTTPLGDIPTDEWYDLFGLPVLEGQEEIHQDLQDFSDQVNDGLDDAVGELEDIESDVESIDTNIGIGNGLLGDLKSIGQSIQSTLSSILSGVTDLVQEIVLSTETFIAGLLNSIMGGLGGWLSTMREAFSIWHYVVEWIGSISTVFSWFWSVAGSTSYYIQLPIYASLAGAVVLAFYKRFGK